MSEDASGLDFVGPLDDVSVYLFDKNRTLIQCAGEVLKNAGFEKEQIIGKPIEEILPDTIKEKYKLIYDIILSGQMVSFTEEYRGRYYKQIGTNYISEAGNNYGIFISLDITNAVKAGESLLDMAFLASHKLRSPIATLMGFVDLLAQPESGIKEQYIEYLKEIKTRLQKADLVIHQIQEKTDLAQIIAQVGVKTDKEQKKKGD